jgi:hypothetical protein
MIFGLLLLISSAFAQDILLEITQPVQSDQRIRVATYYRNERYPFFFTIVYRNDKKLYSEIAPQLMASGLCHLKSEHWARKAAFQAFPSEVPEERASLIPAPPALYRGPLAGAFLGNI